MREHFQSDQQIVDRLEACLNKLAPMRETVMDLARQNRNEEAVAYMEANNIPTIKAAQAELDLLIENIDFLYFLHNSIVLSNSTCRFPHLGQYTTAPVASYFPVAGL